VKSEVFVALDFNTVAAAEAMANQLKDTGCGVKVGKELFTLAGPDFVRRLVAQGFRVFLDLKFHDIPSTVAKAVAASAELGVYIVNVHASGGSKMMQAAKAALLPYGERAPKLIAVTVLTSTQDEDLQELGLNGTAAEQVERLAKLAQQSGLDGVVCSAQEAGLLQQVCGSDFYLVTPGIRPKGSAAGDQQRIMTPEQAQSLGVQALVIGRPITQANDPLSAWFTIRDSLTHDQ